MFKIYKKFHLYFLSILNIIFLSLISVSIYKVLCRPDLDIFRLDIDVSNLFSNWFFNEWNCCNSTTNLQPNFIIYYFIQNPFFLFEQFIDIDNFFILDLKINTISNLKLEKVFYFNSTFQTSLYKYNDVIEVKFFTKINSFRYIEFYCLQDSIFLISNDTTLIFFRISTFESQEFSCIVIFLVSPNSLISCLTKLQCFCFDNIFISSVSSIDLPVIFMLDFNLIFFLNKKLNLLFFYLLLEK